MKARVLILAVALAIVMVPAVSAGGSRSAGRSVPDGPTTTTTGQNPEAEPPLAGPATLTVTPNVDLLDGDTVTVTGSGFPPDSFLYLAQCAVGSFSCNPEVWLGEDAPGVDADGNFTVELSVRLRARAAGGVDTNCIAVACEIRAGGLGPEYNLAVPIGFDPDQPIPPPPSVTVDPASDLADRQLVAVEGANFEPGIYVGLSICLVDDGFCTYLPSGARPDAEGTFSTSVNVRRQVRRYLDDPETTELLDCATNACVLRVEWYDGYHGALDTPITFDPVLPLPVPPTIEVDPNADLPYSASVTVTGAGFTPHSNVYAQQCLLTATDGRCPVYAEGEADDLGTVTLQLTVRRRVASYRGGVLDCVEVGTTCRVALYGNDGLEQAETTIAFDPNAPIPPPPVVAVTPNTDLDWRHLVSVTGANFGANEQVLVQQCTTITVGVPPNEFEYARCVGANYRTPPAADADGNLDTIFNARRIMTNGFDLPIDCSESVGKCYLQVARYGFDSGEIAASVPGELPASVPLGFDPTSVQTGGPAVTVTPAVGLSGGDVVSVTGSGFTSNASIGFAVCRSTVQSLSDCDIGGAPIFQADVSGTFTRAYTVRDRITTPNGVVDCTSAPGSCVLGVANISDYIEFSLTPLSFGPNISILDTTVREGTGGTTSAPVVVELSRASNRDVSVHWTTVDGNATAAADYIGAAGDLVIPAGETSGEIPLAVIADAMDETGEHLSVELSDAHGGPLVDGHASVRITDDDRRPRLTMGNGEVFENDGDPLNAYVPVFLSAPSGRDITVKFLTHHDSARSGRDFVRTRGTSVIPAGWTGWLLVVPLVGDNVRERRESFTVELREAINATIGDATSRITITDDD